MPLEIRGAHFLIRSAQLVRGTRLEQALANAVNLQPYRTFCVICVEIRSHRVVNS